MPLIHTTSESANWHDVLDLWSRITNWPIHKPPARELDHCLRMFAIALWSEKDWLSAQYPDKKIQIEEFMSESETLSIVADLANTAKHRFLTRNRRSTAEQTPFRGQVSVSGGATRQLHFVKLADGRVIEIMEVLRGALDALESFRLQLRASALAAGEH